jgi:16S rRNA (guanine527-N7)-methyltransferase
MEHPLLEKVLEKMELKIAPLQQYQLIQYVQLIIDGLTRQRLVGTKNVSELICKHIPDCLYPMKLNLISPGKMLDLGTGAGLPGIPLKICLPGQMLYLMDSNRRKINFLQMVSEELGLEQVFFLPGRAEEWAREEEYRERFELVVSRAVADTAALAEMALPLTMVGGMVLLYKGPRGEVEIEDAAEALRLCGGKLKDLYRYRLPTGEERTLLCLSKIQKTPVQYPRRAGQPVKKPLSHKNISQ